LEAQFAPTLNFVPNRGLRYAVSIDEGSPKIIDMLADKQHSAWQEAVKNGVRKSNTTIEVSQPGLHYLRIWMVDPASVLQKIIIDTGNLKPSYLGPIPSKQAE